MATPAPTSSTLSPRQETMKTVAAATSSGLSIIGALYILGRYWYTRRRMKTIANGEAAATGNAHHLDVTKELIHVLAWLDLVGALGRIFGTLPTRTFNQSLGEPVTGICKLQAVVITFGDVSPIAWNFVMAFNLFRWICMGEDQQMLQQKIKWYILGMLAFTFTIDFLALGFHKFGDAGLWCWVVIPGAEHHREELYWKLLTLYFWVITGAIAMSTLLVLVKRDMKTRLQSHENEDAREAYDGVVHNLTIYIVAFIVCWLPAVLDRGYFAIKSKEIFTLSMMHACVVPLQGFVNAVIYGKFHIWIVRHANFKSVHSKSSSRTSNKHSEDSVHRREMLRDQERQHFGTATIFITTFDMNWNPFPTNLQSIQKHLLRMNYPTAYRSITSLAGSALRGQVQDATVCQIVFVNNADDASGNFQFHPNDGRVWSQRKTFKEVVGIPIRYFDASIAFVSCNLSPGDHFQHTSRSVLEKHAIATSLIHSFGMDADRAAVDFPNLYHHTFLSGNLNYDVEMPRQGLLNTMEQAYKAECLKRATDAAIGAKLKAVQQPAQRQSADRRTSSGGRERFSSPNFGCREPQNANVRVEWNLLYFKSRNSLGRSSNVSSSSDDAIGSEGDAVYQEIYTSCHDELPFTLLQSPAGLVQNSSAMAEPLNASMLSNNSSLAPDLRNTSVLESEEAINDASEVRINVSGGVQGDDGSARARRSWMSFLDSLFPLQAPERTSSSNSFTANPTRRSTMSSRNVTNGGNANGAVNARNDGKKVNDLLSKSQLVADNTMRKWKELLRFDELRAAIEAKEAFCGFEEPEIQFLPSFPRKVGTSASFSMLSDRTCKDLFLESNLDISLQSFPPAYKDRVLSHSLQDTKQRLRNVGYWLCEEITTSTHKPVCSLYELEIDRFFSYKMDEAARVDSRQGNRALRDKTGVQEFKIKLVNLDANIWSTVARDLGSQLSSNSSNTKKHRKVHAAPASHPASPSESRGGANDSNTSSRASDSTQSPSQRPPSVRTLKKKRSVANIVDRVLRKDRHRSSTTASGSKASTPNPYSDFQAEASGSHPLALTGDRLSMLTPFHLELVPVEPVSISTVFPLPSEDLYALQRKVYEVAHSVQNGFQSSANNEDLEESLLAYTNCRTVAWKEAGKQGVTHTGITKAVNGVVHIAVTIKAEKGHGGQGVLCIQEQDLLARAKPVFSESEPIPFDVTLTWGGKHVGTVQAPQTGMDALSHDSRSLKKRSALSTASASSLTPPEAPAPARKSSNDALNMRDDDDLQHNCLPFSDDTSSTSSYNGDASDHLPLPPLARLHIDDYDNDIATTNGQWDRATDVVDDGQETSTWTHMSSCMRRCASASAQPGFFDPARRKHTGANAHLPYRYRSLLLLSEQDDDDDDAAFDAVIGLDEVSSDTDGHSSASDSSSRRRLRRPLNAHGPLSASAAIFLDKEHMTELTVSLLESTWVFLLLLGILASFVAWSVDMCVLLVQRMRTDFTDLGGAWMPDYLLYTGYRVFILVLGVACTFFVCPNAAGSGIPEMRSILGGFPFPNYLSKRTLIAKCFGLVFALGSGLSIGKEGPFVHLSCIIAHQLLRMPLFEQIRRSQDLTHHVLAAACAVGVTATFGTPIGGVLFSIEVTTTYYVTSNYWRAFFSSVVGVVVFRILNSLMDGNNVSLFTTTFAVLPYKSYEITFFLILACICGILGALFVRTYRSIMNIKTHFMETYLFTRWPWSRAVAPFLYAAFVALIFALVEFPVGSFMQLSQRQMIDDMFSTGNLASADSTHLAKDFGQLWTSPSLALNLFSYICVRFVSTVISATVMVPSGIVTPVFAVGAAFGRLFGEMIVFFGGGNELAGGYAVVGAASLTAGVTGTISIAVIVFELTSQLSYMIPVLLCVLLGRAVAAFFSLDIYDTISRQKNLPQWPDLTKQKSYGLVAGDLMRAVPPYWILRHQTLSSLQQALKEAPEDVTLFPIIDDATTMVYLGAVDREELESIVEMWTLSQASSIDNDGKKDTLHDRLAVNSSDGSDSDSEDVAPRSRHIEMTNVLALAGLSKSQATRSVDLVRLELLNLDTGNFHVHRDTFASQVILLISVYKSPQLFVTARGKLLGVIHASDLLARSRRFML
ncbi:Inositol polyphosphate 5-phosphatase, partial [Globisporangium splendens]